MKSNQLSESSHTELHSLFVDELRDILWAEKHLLKALPKMSKAAKDPKLSAAFDKHLNETKGHVERLGEIFSILGLASRAKKCFAMEGLLKEGDELAEEYQDSAALDAALIAAAQKVEHYEMATYGTLRAFAKRLGYKEIEEIITATYNEESAADEALTAIALDTANEEAATE
ncbi:ferritin-like domain-containing protein [Luteolibacter flavescens]|uniref:Ferritin-like domain-containing protein n=1 Tax=Luteolibacter flavescens TaxID=1859460 RepID=A0ABT3FSQ9_9BACT|nr:ferritin-like domain-containing protein [Luteolibacter flavescens]MCW1886015.1 ferritin-like domain-containing protein [Luteolibacter flavescens]